MVGANEQPIYKEEVGFYSKGHDKRPTGRENGPVNQEQICIDDRANENLPMDINIKRIEREDNAEFLRSLRRTIIHRVLEKIESIENERLKGPKPLPHSKGRFLWKPLRDRLAHVRSLAGAKVKSLDRQQQWVGLTMRGSVASARKEINPPNEETVEVREGEKADFRIEEKAPNVDVVDELDKQATGGTVHLKDKKRKMLTIEGKRTTSPEVPVKDDQEKFTHPRPHHDQTKIGSPLDSQTTLNESQSFKLPNGDFEPRARHMPMKSHLFRYSDHSNEQESMKKPTTDEKEPQLELPVIEPKPMSTEIPLQHPKMAFKRRKGPRYLMSPLKFPFFSSDTSEQISWSEFTKDPENESVPHSQLQLSPEMLSDESTPPIVLISSYDVEDPQTNGGNVAFKPGATENAELGPLPVKSESVRSPLAHQLLRRTSDQSQGNLKDVRDDVMNPLGLNFKKRSSSTAYLDSESIDLPHPSTDLAQSKVRSDPSNLASSGRKSSRPKLSPIPEAVAIPLSSADKRICQMDTLDKKDDEKEEGSMTASSLKMAMSNQRFSKLSADKSVTVQYKWNDKHVKMPKSGLLKLHQSPQSRHNQEPELGSAKNPPEVAVHTRSHPKKQPEPAFLPYSNPNSPKRNPRDSHAKPSSQQ
ncbi:hypothetical protein TSMEX_004031 [Taenia solium]|eukprot:TsM_000138100 transcript=TsM_000138100 gene=TsM_000138100